MSTKPASGFMSHTWNYLSVNGAYQQCLKCGAWMNDKDAHSPCPGPTAEREQPSPEQARDALQKDAPRVFSPYIPLARDMTTRERFAMAAMQGFCAVTAYRDVNPDTLAAWSVEQADALLAALEAK